MSPRQVRFDEQTLNEMYRYSLHLEGEEGERIVEDEEDVDSPRNLSPSAPSSSSESFLPAEGGEMDLSGSEAEEEGGEEGEEEEEEEVEDTQNLFDDKDEQAYRGRNASVGELEEDEDGADSDFFNTDSASEQEEFYSPSSSKKSSFNPLNN